jgi:ferredoxin-type protein NapH
MAGQSKIKRYRRTVQTAVFLMMFIIPLLNIMEIYFIKGTFYSLDVGSAAAADPIAVFQAAMSSKSVNVYMALSVVIPILLMLLAGRVWCSWMCPYHLMAEGVSFIKKKLKMKKSFPVYSPAVKRRTENMRLIILVCFITLAGIAGIPLLNLISAPGVISSQALVLVKFHYVTFELVFILALIIAEFVLFPFFWCRLFCPTGTFLSLFKSERGMHLKRTSDGCSMCGSCRKVCPMGLDPVTDGSSLLCHNCGDCIDTCPDNRKKETLRFISGRQN